MEERRGGAEACRAPESEGCMKRGISSEVEHIVANDKATGSIPVSRSKTLMQLAEAINKTARAIHDAESTLKNGRFEIGKILLEVKARLPDESNMPFGTWCLNYLRKSDGSPFSYVTIANYMKYANNPETLKAERKRQATYSRQRTKALQYVSSSTSLMAKTDEEQLNQLVYAWDHASEKSRKQFLEMMGLTNAKR